MKIWVVPFGELDNQRIVAAHRELHAIYANVFRRGTKWKRWDEPHHIQHFLALHDETLDEMLTRGIFKSHHTPPPSAAEVVPLVEQVLYDPLPEELRTDRWLLVSRWNGTYKGRVPEPPEYKELIDAFHEQGGCHHQPAPGLDICGLCKRFQMTEEGLWIPRIGTGSLVKRRSLQR